MSNDRAACRNIHICDSATGATLGGVCQNGSITEANFLWILAHILLVAEAPLSVKHRDSDRAISPTHNPIEPRTYDVNCDGMFLNLTINSDHNETNLDRHNHSQ